ncbi:MAG: ATP-binding protein [Tissierellia bacterium]|nr:ATP-binding protein [Tissierellia bacterium]
MKIAGMTSQSEAYVVTKEHSIRINEYLKIKDPLQGDLLCETIETHTYNRFMPLDPDSDMADKRVVESMKTLGYDLDNERIYIAKVRLLNEAPYPIETGSEVVNPSFSEVKPVLIRSNAKQGLILGPIQNTDGVYQGADPQYKDLMTTVEDGKVQEQRELPLIFHLWGMKDYPHIGIFGGSGSGKSYGLRVFLEELMRLHIPTIVSDPHNEMTFVTEDGRFDTSYEVLEVGTNTGIAFQELSSFDLIHLLKSRGDLTESMESTIELLKKSKESVELFQTKIKYLLEIHEMGGEEGARREMAHMAPEEQNTLEDKLRLFGVFGKFTNPKSLKGILWRMNSLRSTGIFDREEASIEDMMKAGKTVVIQGARRVLTVYMSYILRKLYYLRRDYLDGEKRDEDQYFPPFVAVIDEAHNFAPRGADAPSKTILREIAQEGRKYGSFLVLATQRPSILDDTTTAQLNSKFLFRTTRETDIKTIREETDISSEEAKRLPYLKSGNVFFSSAIMGRTLFLRMRQALSHQPKSENPFDELETRRVEKDGLVLDILRDYSPFGPSDFPQLLQILEKSGEHYTVEALKGVFRRLEESGALEKKENIFGEVYACQKS